VISICIGGTTINPAKLVAALAALGLWACPVSAANLRCEDAASRIGETATVCGVAASAKFEANVPSRPTLLDLEKSYPHAVLPRIYGDNRSKFGISETSLRGKRICVTRQIGDYREKPEIVLTDPSQLTNNA
jgi:hypothetical protein